MLRRTLKRIGVSYRKSRPVSHKSASPDEQEKFKIDTKTINKLANEGYAIVADDEAHAYLW